MDSAFSSLSTRVRWGGFVIILALVLAGYVGYGINLVSWKNATDYGWRAMYDSGPHVVDEVFGLGWQAGLRPGDRILFINGRSYDTFDELFFTVRNMGPGELNAYTVLRDGEPVDINITNGVLGYRSVFKRSGPLFLAGLLYVFIGVLVYLMKPGARESRVFLIMTAVLGVSMSYASPSDLMRPLWLFQVRQFFDVFLPAPIIHLALIFPRQRRVMDPSRWFWPAPYIVSLIIFYYFRPFTATYWDPPANMDLVNNLYLLVSVLVFITLTVLNFRKDTVPLERIQSRMVLLGISIGFLVPVVELVARNVGDWYLFDDPAVSFALLFSVFPVCVGYAVARHDLFEIDVTVRRAFGYALSSSVIVAAYASLVVFLNVSVPSIDLARSQVFTALFAVAVVITFKPLHEKVQRVVDRKFYRVRLDYKDAVIEISSALTSYLNMDEIIVRIIHAAKDVMSIDSAGIILVGPEEKDCQTRFIHDSPDDEGEEYSDDCLDPEDPLVQLMMRIKKVVTVYDLEKELEIESSQWTVPPIEDCENRFTSLKALVAVPMIHQGEVKGILMVGRKKSGRFYVREDIDLLCTLASHGMVALENARLAEQMKREGVIKAELSRYLSPHVIQQVMSEPSTRETGGERRHVVVLISDIRGFTEHTKALPNDTLVAILNEYRTEMVRIIFDYEGALDKYVGDAIVAVFGGLIPLENPTSNAVKTAIDMVDSVSWLNEKWQERYDGFSMDVGFGIDAGIVFMGNVGSPDRMEFTVIGEAVNNADNLSSLALPNQILLSEAASAALGGKVDVRELSVERSRRKKDGQKILEVVK